eukprot:snap_masked-scaffold_11-processed-gene-1.39-mRNA-1 protein AED:0.27 eAED:0.36 QI:0/0/0/1/1/1/2/0/616
MQEKLDNYFKFTERGSSFWTEVRGGSLNFMVLSFILLQNRDILTLTGVDCECPSFFPVCFFAPTSPFGEAYFNCMEPYDGQFITGTAASIAICTAILALLTNTPFTISPISFRQLAGMPWGQSMATLLLSMLIGGAILLLNLFPKVKFDKIIPQSQKYAITGGLGLFLTFLGLITSYGLAVVVSDTATIVTLGGCALEERNPLYNCDTRAIENTLNLSIAGQTFTRPGEVSARLLEEENIFPEVDEEEFDKYMLKMGKYFETENIMALEYMEKNAREMQEATFEGSVSCSTNDAIYTCDTYANEGGKMANMYTRLSIFAIIIASVFLGRTGFGKKSNGTIFWTVLIVALLSWSRGASYSFFEDEVMVGGEDRWSFFTKYAEYFPFINMVPTFDFDGYTRHDDFIRSFFTLTYLYVMENTGAIYGLCTLAGLDKITGERKIWFVAGISGIISTLFGVPPVTIHFMSAAGIVEGARTGLAGLVTAFLFLLCFIFSPLLASIPPWASGIALIFSGLRMIKNIKHIDMDNAQQALPAFTTICLMPFTHSITNGLVGGLIMYAFIKFGNWIADKIMNKGWKERKREELREEKQRENENEEEGIPAPGETAAANPVFAENSI